MSGNYRIMRMSRNAYHSVFDDMLRQDTNLAEAGFAKQMEAFFAKSLIYSDSFSRAMDGLGNETLEIVCNGELMQKTWAATHGVTYDEDDWVRQIMWAQVEEFRPDVVFIQGLTSNSTGFLPENGFREKFPFVRAVVGFAGYFHPADRLEGVDVVISGLPSVFNYYRAENVPTELIYHGFDASLVERVPEPTGDMIDLSFFGSTGLGYGENHAVRYWELLELCCGSDIQLWANEKFDADQLAMSGEQLAGLGQSLRGMVEVFRESISSSSGTHLPVLPLSLIFPDRVHEAIYGLEMYATLRQSRLTLNRHFDPDSGIREIGNMRTFEATGIGTCMLVNEGDNVRDLYEPDTEIVTYASVEECLEKANWLLQNDEKRREIAAAGQKRTLRDHTIASRCAVIDGLIRGMI